jgi:hypothetical protein
MRITLAVIGIIAFTGLVVAISIPARPGPAMASQLTTDVANLPPIKVLPSKGVTNQISPALANQIAVNLINDFQNEVDALTNRDKDLAKIGTTGEYLQTLTKQIDNANGKEIVVTSRRIDNLEIKLELAVRQAPPIVVAKVSGTQKTVTLEGNPPSEISHSDETPFEQTFRLKLSNGRYLIESVER